MNNILVLLFSAGGAAFLTAIIAGIRSLRTTRLNSEEALMTRLNNAVKQAERDGDVQRRRAERAERYADQLRNERDEALNQVARLQRRLIEHGEEESDDLHP